MLYRLPDEVFVTCLVAPATSLSVVEEAIRITMVRPLWVCFDLRWLWPHSEVSIVEEKNRGKRNIVEDVAVALLYDDQIYDLPCFFLGARLVRLVKAWEVHHIA